MTDILDYIAECPGHGIRLSEGAQKLASGFARELAEDRDLDTAIGVLLGMALLIYSKGRGRRPVDPGAIRNHVFRIASATFAEWRQHG